MRQNTARGRPWSSHRTREELTPGKRCQTRELSAFQDMAVEMWTKLPVLGSAGECHECYCYHTEGPA
ncbi:hypothetical protein CesoFtcFv8_027699 [Champsocephalus esox]|uniref:Uncharacterized protein n=1 Tax=Champsocephalus esox TaxID=159716 RepID=A0AAN8AW72_9TELE|nr:hypothetical protein CesoFtcFv8_027699 [Champsocephalus esox]